MNFKKTILFTGIAFSLLCFNNSFGATYQININKSQNYKTVKLREEQSHHKTEITIINDIKVRVYVPYNDGASSYRYCLTPGDTLFLFDDDHELDNVLIEVKNYLNRTIFKGSLPNHSVNYVSQLSQE